MTTNTSAKTLSVITLLLIIAISLNACTNSPAAQSSDKPVIVAANFAIYDFTRNIAGGYADVVMLMPPGVRSHNYEPSPKDIIEIMNSTLFLYVGGPSDVWVERIIASTNNSGDINAVKLIDCVDPIIEYENSDHIFFHDHGETGSTDLYANHDESMEAKLEIKSESGNDVEYDEHIWTSPQNAIKMVNRIVDALCAVLPEQSDEFIKNADEYANKLGALDNEFKNIVTGASVNTLVFADRFPFVYFTEEYGIEYYVAFPGCADETEPSAAAVAKLIDTVNTLNIPVILHTEYANENLADTIAAATNAKKLMLHSCHTISREDLDAGATYLSLMRENAMTLKEALLCH